MRNGYQDRLTSIFRFHNGISSLCTTSVESFHNDGTAQKVDKISCYLRFVLCDACKCECQG